MLKNFDLLHGPSVIPKVLSILQARVVLMHSSSVEGLARNR